MRLICPNCGAQYAVSDGVIPSGGRDVQCSNCAHTWFETPGASSDDQPPEPRKIVPPTPPTPAASDAGNPFSGSIGDAFKNVVDDEPDMAPAPQPPVGRKPVDRSVADILREEAALEAAQRRTEIGGHLESQSDLGLTDPAPEPPKQPAAPQPVPVPAVATAAANFANASASRRELLPDIEEINSSLQSDSERGNAAEPGPEDADNTKRRGFRRGFVTMLVIILVLFVLYVFADQIATMVPAIADALKSYVDAVDVGRIWLDDKVHAMLLSIAVE